MAPQTNQNLRARGIRESALQAPVYVLATSLAVGAIMLSGAPPGVAWGMFLIGCALAVAPRNSAGTGQTRATKGAALFAGARR